MTAQPTYAVSVEHATVVRGGAVLLDDVSWQVRTGERWVLFGANGSGKTTLLQVASSWLFPTRGTVHLLGHRLGRVDARTLRRRIGYVGPAQTSLVRANFTALDIVVTGRHASFVDTRWDVYEDEDWDHARHCLQRLAADNLMERVFETLSEGEKKRVLIARALMPRPDLLLLDEPGSGLDLGSREHLVSSLAGLAGEAGSPTIVLVTHHVEDIPPGFDHAVMLSGGRVAASGRTSEVLDSGRLSAVFGLPLVVEQEDGRWHARRQSDT